MVETPSWSYKHERWCVTLDAVAGADPREDGVGDSELCTFGRNEAADLSHDLKRKSRSHEFDLLQRFFYFIFSAKVLA